MAEVFAVVSAGVGVAAAAGQLIGGIMKLHSFCSQIRDIPDDIQTAVDNLSMLIEVLEFIQIEIDCETRPNQQSIPPSLLKVLSNLQQSSQQVEQVLAEMQIKLGSKKFWGRVKAVGVTKRLESAAKRVENAQRMILLLLTVENRMMFRQNFKDQSRELTAISTHIVSILNTGQVTNKTLGTSRSICDVESSNMIHEDPDIAPPSTYRSLQRTHKARGRKTARLKLRLPNSFLSSVWEFSVYKANQGWDFSIRSHNIRHENAQIFQASLSADLAEVYDLLHNGRASMWDRDPSGRGVLHYAASGCGEHGSSVVEYLVQNGADIYAVDDSGCPPLFSLSNYSFTYEDEQTDHRLAVAYKAFTSHRDWISPHPSQQVQLTENFKFTTSIIDIFPLFNYCPEETIRSILHEMWPPWKYTSPADRMAILFPEFPDANTLFGSTSPLCTRVCLSRQYVQDSFANWDTKSQVQLIEYTFEALAEQLVSGYEKGKETARSFLNDMQIANSLINTLLIVDTLRLFIHRYVRDFESRSIQKFTIAAQDGLKHYVSELMLLGIDTATLADIERQLLFKNKDRTTERVIYNCQHPYKIIAIDCSLNADDCHLWLSNPLDEWAGEFWDMIDHPERAIPGAWNMTDHPERTTPGAWVWRP